MPTDPADFERKMRCHDAMPFVFCCAAAGVVVSMWFGFTPKTLFSGTAIGWLTGYVIALAILDGKPLSHQAKEPPASPASSDDELRYSMDSLRAVDLVKEEIGEALNRLATQRAVSEGRSLVTADDVVESIPGAFRELQEEF
jgi:histone H3/H4